ncbi:aldo/keto reductase, partial [Serratia marcescens]
QAPRWYGGRNEVERTVAAVAEVAAARGVPPAQIALAWLLAKPGVASPLVGMSKPHHLQDALAALDLRLSQEDVAALEAPMAHAARPERW